MTRTNRARQLVRDVLAKSYLAVALMIAAGPLAAVTCSPGHTNPFGMLSITISVFNVVFTLAYWKPVTSYLKATRRARFEHSVSKVLADRAYKLRDKMLAQTAAFEAMNDPAMRVNAYPEVASTISELEQLLGVLEPRHVLVDQVIAEADAWGKRFPHRRIAAWARRSLVSGLTDLAVAVAGERGARLRETWLADLAGAPEEGLVLTRWQQVSHAAGFVIASVRMRGRVLAEPLWRPVDWLLASESRSRTTITLAVGAQVIYIVKHDGMHGLLTDGWGWCGGCALALHLFFRWLRQLRGIELAVATERSPEN